MVIQEIESNNRKIATRLLETFKLPTDDLNSSMVTLFGAFENDELCGCIGFEQFGVLGLLRSLAVDKRHQGKGIGISLVRFLEEHLAKKGVHQLFLLTETAEVFFKNREYQSMDRLDAPEALKASAEFSKLCPDSALLLMKKL